MVTNKNLQETEIYSIMRELSPQDYYSLNGNSNPEIGSDHFAATSSIEYTTGCDGRVGMLFNGNDYLKLATTQKYAGNFSFSVVVKFDALPNTYNGVMGGVIYGNGYYGLGYALGFANSYDDNKLCFQVYTNISARCYSPIAPKVGEWYHIVGKVNIVGGRVEMSLWVNGVKSTSTTENTQGYIGYNSINESFDGNIYMGRVGQSGINYMHGIIQDIAFWNRTITDSDANTLWRYYQNILPSSGILQLMQELSPQVYYPLNKSTSPKIGTDQFAATSAIQYTSGCDGREGVLCNGNDYLKLATTQKYTGNFSFSVVVKFDSFPNTYDGVMGGVIYGNGYYGLGYALGFAHSYDDNKLCFQVYTNISARCYSPIAPKVGEWYHIVGKVNIVGGRVEMSLWVNGVKSTSTTENTQGYIGYNSINESFDGNIYMGRVGQSGINYMHGIIQDIAFWNRTITDSDANTLWRYYQNVLPSSGILQLMQELAPQVYYPLDKSTSPKIGTNQFAATSTIQYTSGCDGREGVLCNGNDYLKLATAQKYTGNFSFSVVVKFDSFPNTYDGVMGGVIYGNGYYGLGYALGFAHSYDDNKLCFQVYTNISARCYSPIIPTVGKWYHIVGRVNIVGGRVEMSLWVNGVKATSTTNNTQGYIGYNSINESFDGNIYMGRVGQSGINYMHGIIQDIAFWNESIADSVADALWRSYYNTFID